MIREKGLKKLKSFEHLRRKSYSTVNAPSSTDGATWFDFDSGYSGIKGYIVEYSPLEGDGGGSTGQDN